MAILTKIADTIEKALTLACKNQYGGDLVSVIVYGSTARNRQTFQSDIDILLIVNNLPDGRMNRMKDFAEIEEALSEELQDARLHGWNTDLSPVIRKPEEVNLGGYFYLDMVDDAVILYDKNDFFSAYLRKFKKRLTEYGAEKKRWKGGYYWEIKPDLKPDEVIQL